MYLPYPIFPLLFHKLAVDVRTHVYVSIEKFKLLDISIFFVHLPEVSCNY